MSGFSITCGMLRKLSMTKCGEISIEENFPSVILNPVFWGEEFSKKHPWYIEVSIAPLFAQVIYNINTRQSVSELLK